MSSNQYDFIIVGGGTSGLVVATRLTEDPAIRVLVLEAGDDHSADPRVTTPALWPSLLGSEVDWAYQSEPQTALNGKKIPLAAGRILGGSSSINGLAFVANSKFSIDSWESLGNSGWNWENLAPYFQKSFALTKPPPAACEHLGLDYIDEGLRLKFKGRIQASFAEETNDPLPKAWVDTFKGLGYALSGDPFSGKAIGGYVTAMNIDPVTKQRSDALSAYYKPVQSRGNLHVITSAVVDKILLHSKKSGVVASGVSYLLNKDGKYLTATASKEVILAAGVYHTPKLLELSGVGSASLLNSFGIPVVIDNSNVGENLQDHPNAGFSFEARDGVETVDALARQDMAAIGAAMERYARDCSGPFASNSNFAGGFLPVVDFLSSNGKEELEKQLQSLKDDGNPFTKHHAAFIKSLLSNPSEASGCYFSYPAQGNFVPKIGSNEIMQSAEPGNYVTMCCMLVHPFSRGSCHITSSSPEAKVSIDPKFLAHPLDLEILARHVKYILKIAHSEPLKGFLKPGGRMNHGAPTSMDDLDEIKEYVKKATLSSWHPTSTCAMLPEEKGGVVNERLVVYGTKNLRIVDASVFPLSTRGNCQTTVYAVAERAADIIKADYTSVC